MGRVDGKVAFITGAARGQGRAEAVKLAAEGADIIAIDISGPVVAGLKYETATAADLEQTVRLVEQQGRRILARTVDVRDLAALQSVVDDGVAAFGSLDIVVANAGIMTWGRVWELTEDQWQTLIDINLTGVWRTVKAVAPGMIERGRGGSIILISSVCGLKGLPGQAHYTAAKHGITGLTKSAAIELGKYGIRVNSVHPWGVDTNFGDDTSYLEMFTTDPEYEHSFQAIYSDPLAQPEDVADMVLFLASEESRMVTGAQMVMDAGATKV